jgi:preprotein translocase subunit SecE
MLERINIYIKESFNELTEQVEWPSWKALNSTTMVVLASTLVIALIIFIMDALSSILMENVYKL